MKVFNLLGVPFESGSQSDGLVAPIDPSDLSDKYFELDAFTNAGLYSAVSPGLVLANEGDSIQAWQNSGSFVDSPQQATLGNRPIARQDVQNGGWGVEFNGIGHFLNIASGGLSAAAFVNCTIYLVINGSGTVFSRTGGSDACQLTYGNPSINRNATEFLAEGNQTPAGCVVDCYQYDGSAMRFERNGGPNGTALVSKTFANAVNSIGCTNGPSEFLGGLIHYLVIFLTIHAQSTRAGVQQFLMARWGVN